MVGETRAMKLARHPISFEDEHSRAMAAQSEASRKETRAREAIAKLQIPSSERMSKANLMTAKVRRLQAGMQFTDWAKPFAIGALILFFFIGPGISAIYIIFKAMPWYLWLGSILIFLLLWRNQ